MDKISLKAPAKINLYLRILGKRDDGYHQIDSLMQTIDLYDEITLEKSDIIEMVCDDPALPVDENNLALKATLALRDEYYFPGVRIDLKKKIPYGSGLGGGSSDAGFVIRGLCKLYGIKPNLKTVIALASAIGSDVPFFLTGGQARVSGRGEIINPTQITTDYSVVVITCSATASTAQIYQDVKINLTKNEESFLLLKRIDFSRFRRLLGSFKNDLEEVTLKKLPELSNLKEILDSNGADYSAMTGSGSAFFGIFFSRDIRQLKMEKILGPGFRVFYCRPVLLPPFYEVI